MQYDQWIRLTELDLWQVDGDFAPQVAQEHRLDNLGLQGLAEDHFPGFLEKTGTARTEGW